MAMTTATAIRRPTPSTSCCSPSTGCTSPICAGTSASTRTRRSPRWPATASNSPTPRRPSPPTPSRAWSARSPAATPPTTGVYYDDSWNRELLPAGTTRPNAPTAKPGAEVTYFEQADQNPLALDAGQGLAGLPNSILQHDRRTRRRCSTRRSCRSTRNTCEPVYPHEYLRVNTIFEVAKEAGLRTAWSDKHPAYDILAGPLRRRHRRPLHAGDQLRSAEDRPPKTTGPPTTR